jgi:hypothetical protein
MTFSEEDAVLVSSEEDAVLVSKVTAKKAP